ncbi:MAG: VCBS repeat-containing protein, partial [Acidobacteria bacterium]|nr:VCBS repeat-containing protein [Acidobacteriota bacterium]
FMEATTISISATATDNTSVTKVEFLINGAVFSTDLSAPYRTTYSIPLGALGPLTIGARATDTLGRVGVATETVVTVIPDPPPVVSITSPANGATPMEGSTIAISADAADNIAVASVVFAINGIEMSPDTVSPYTMLFGIPLGVTTLTIEATAMDNLWRTATDILILTVIPDPLTTVVGKVVDLNSTPVSGATVTTLNNLSGVTDADGIFTITGVPTALGNIIVSASKIVNKRPLTGNSAPVAPVQGGITDVQKIILAYKGPLYPGRKFSAGYDPASVAVADFNVDNIPDIVTANFGSNDVSVLLGNGDGTFQVEQRFATGESPESVAIADLNADGFLDLVTANSGSDDVLPNRWP